MEEEKEVVVNPQTKGTSMPNTNTMQNHKMQQHIVMDKDADHLDLQLQKHQSAYSLLKQVNGNDQIDIFSNELGLLSPTSGQQNPQSIRQSDL